MKKMFFFFIMCWTSGRALSQGEGVGAKELAGRYWYLITPPTAQQQWESWQTGLRLWRDSLLSALHYDGSYYQRPEYRWASRAYSVCYLMAGDRLLYDGKWNYDIKKYLDKYERSYGGVDIVLLWAAYPQLGFDNRDQYEFYRNLPGGMAALKKLADQLHAMGKKLFIAYNPWDPIARNKGKVDEDELIQLVKEMGADGIFLDTISSVAGFRDRLDAARPGVVFQSEVEADPALLGEIHQSWLETPVWNDSMRNSELDEIPYIVRNRWLDQRHLTYHLSRWSHAQTTVLQNAWMNGCGVVIWENIFGTMNELNARDRSMLRTMLPLLRRYSDFFTRGRWTPLVPTGLYRTFVSCWEWEGKKLWTIVNRQEQFSKGPLLETEHIAGMRYFDMVTGKEVAAVINGGKAMLSIELRPRDIGCLLAIPEREVTAEFKEFLDGQARGYREADRATSYELPHHVLQPVASTRKYAAGELPGGMRVIPVPADPFEMTVQFRQRECGFYPAEGVTDISYTMALDRPGFARRTVRLSSYAMDETPVTNAEYYRFIRATDYRPAFPDNFLRDWVGGHPPKGAEQHPVVWITIDDARAYARWAGKRLPTEEEWQWAAQGGEAARSYPWGDLFDSTVCNQGQTGGGTDVKRFKRGRTLQGLYDMCGNVWQFTESERFDGHNAYCILRGGSWYRTKGSGWYADQGPQKTNFGAKYLFTWPGLDRCGTVGFRCVVDIAP